VCRQRMKVGLVSLRDGLDLTTAPVAWITLAGFGSSLHVPLAAPQSCPPRGRRLGRRF